MVLFRTRENESRQNSGIAINKAQLLKEWPGKRVFLTLHIHVYCDVTVEELYLRFSGHFSSLMLDGCWILVDRRTSGPDEGRAVVGRLFVGGRMLGGRRSSEPDGCWADGLLGRTDFRRLSDELWGRTSGWSIRSSRILANRCCWMIGLGLVNKMASTISPVGECETSTQSHLLR